MKGARFRRVKSAILGAIMTQIPVGNRNALYGID